ncbi:hypothetical protein MIND_01314100 [Mycena indigotica]|uniref:Uncharacterized protein n=1 Tax=Mycena indigotica TaxID=2126181 RepID=A0A8H6S0M4_9AGAR|nr:uncharacterized protein MIND_01314100 [Mycena indigotica]KAF7290734.1 hypothetical protein MIND_01314100 [Mycena indigotica]
MHLRGASAVLCLALFGSALARDPHLVSVSTPAPGVSPVWDLPLGPVLMDVHNTDKYALNGSLADAQWAALTGSPDNDVIHLGEKEYMLSMTHQLRCLDIIRRDYVAGWQGRRTTHVAAQTQHCLNYIRQMVLCRGDRRLEEVVDPFGEHAVEVRGSRTCRDWTAVFESIKTVQEHRS